MSNGQPPAAKRADQMTEFPKRTQSAAKGETGVNLVSLAVNDDLRWIFRRTHNEHDFGIDGYIDLVEEDGSVTGRSISVQIKCGSSYLRESDCFGITFRGKRAHLNYLLNHPIPTLIVICDPETKVCYWEELTPDRTQGTAEGWRITVPFSQTLDASSKERLRLIAGAPADKIGELERYWEMNKVVSEMGAVIYTIDRIDIEAFNTREVSEFFRRLAVTREFAVQNQDKIVLHVWGYDDDERELWEIVEVRRWFMAAEPIVKYWFYFLKTSSYKSSLQILAACVCRVSRREQTGERIKVELQKKDLLEFIKRNFEWLNEMTDGLGLPEDDNKRLSLNAMDALEIRA